MSKLKVRVQKLWDGLPKLAYEHEGDSGIDLYAREDVVVNAGGRKLVGTGIKIALPKGYEAQVRPKERACAQARHHGAEHSGHG